MKKDYGARKQYFVNDIALVELQSEVAVTAWTLPVCVDWARELPDLRHGEEGTVRHTERLQVPDLFRVFSSSI